MNSGPLGTKKPDFKRLEEIIKVLGKYEFVDILKRTGLKNTFTRFFHPKLEMELDATVPERILLVFEELGTTFIKFGQILSTRPDLVGEDVANELATLQDDAPPVSFERIKKVVEEELDNPLDEIFLEFNEEPIASASIAQVYKAKLKDNTIVAVKVQRPDIIDQIRKDITIMRYLEGQLERTVTTLKYYNVSGIIDEFERAIEKELDFSLEARNIEKFRVAFKNNNNICAPRTYNNYSTNKILTMEYIDGVKISGIGKSGIKVNGKQIAKLGAECYFKQIFTYGFFHADPHPGNFFIKNNNVLCFVDFGMMGHLDNEFIDNLAELFVFIIDYDISGIISQLMYMRVIDEATDTEELRSDLIDLLDKYYGAEIKNLGGMITEFSTPDLIAKYKIKLPRDFILLGKVINMAEDIGRSLDPTINAFEIAEPLIDKLLKKRLNPLNILDYQTRYLFELQHIGKDLPRTIRQALLKAKKGEIGIELEVDDLDKFSNKLEKIVNRVSIALVISALIVGSSLVLQSNRGIEVPISGFSVIGAIIFLIATVFAIVLIFYILKNG